MEKSLDTPSPLRFWLPLGLLIGALELVVWAHWNSMAEVASEWQTAKYSHGYLVPIFAGVLLWLWREPKEPFSKQVANVGLGMTSVGLVLCVIPLVLPDDTMIALGNAIGKQTLDAIGVALCVAGSLLYIQQRIDLESVDPLDRWIGLGAILLGAFTRLYGTWISAGVVEYYGLLPVLVGVFLLVGGRSLLKWGAWPIFFLIFMFPLKSEVDGPLSGNLQILATRASTFLLETLGEQPLRQGTTIYVGANEKPVNVAEACSGLRMLTIFGAMSVAVALLIRRPLWQRITIVVSAIPIALLVNIVRIVLTGVIFARLSDDDKQIHDFVHAMWGLVMMPMALGLMYLEFQILDNLFVEDDDEMPVPLALNAGGPKTQPASASGRVPVNSPPATDAGGKSATKQNGGPVYAASAAPPHPTQR